MKTEKGYVLKRWLRGAIFALFTSSILRLVRADELGTNCGSVCPSRVI